MKNNDFSENQKKGIKDFLKISKKVINSSRVSPSFLLYIISSLPNKNNETVFTKSNKMIMKNFLPLKKRIYIEFLIKELENL